jgi:hypothetical protein
MVASSISPVRVDSREAGRELLAVVGIAIVSEIEAEAQRSDSERRAEFVDAGLILAKKTRQLLIYESDMQTDLDRKQASRLIY